MSEFHVVDVGGPALLDLPTYRSLKLVTLHYTVESSPPTPPTQPAKHPGDQLEKK